ncbi:MAG: hypothetical protein LM577_03345 [Thermoproteaceae archaeon]|jgi:hypothetical protein|nr:hypothetical protein [Thermoproteaceae archaeon]
MYKENNEREEKRAVCSITIDEKGRLRVTCELKPDRWFVIEFSLPRIEVRRNETKCSCSRIWSLVPDVINTAAAVMRLIPH